MSATPATQKKPLFNGDASVVAKQKALTCPRDYRVTKIISGWNSQLNLAAKFKTIGRLRKKLWLRKYLKILNVLKIPPPGSHSSFISAAQSDDSLLTPEVFVSMHDKLLKLVKEEMLELQHIKFVEKHFNRSPGLHTDIFMDLQTMEEQRDFILESMNMELMEED
ncbi:hypothetical protein Tco_1523636 [Tanacetum coccineum]